MTIVHRLRTALLLLAALPATATAGGKLFVATDGVDGPDCGSRAAPCRSISQTIGRAPEGATIVVGPGRYGPAEEQPPPGGCGDCLIEVAKRVTIVSLEGPGQTIVDAAGERLHGVVIRADGAAFGGKGRGFTVTGAGIGIAMRADGLRVEGNWVVRNDAATQASAILAVGGARTLIRRNVVADNDAVGIDLRLTDGYVVADNRVSGHRSIGIRADEGGGELTGNAVSSAEIGIRLRGDCDVVRNAVVASDGIGLVLDHGTAGVARYRVSRNTITGSRRQGVHVHEGEPSLIVTLTKNGVFGNGLRAPRNCGLLVEQQIAPGAVAVTRNFWGVASGPAASEPADDACDNAVAAGPFARKERPTRLESAR